MERRGAARASILDVDDRDFRETHASQGYLTTDGMLPFHDPLRYIGKYRGADVPLLGVDVGQSIADSFGNERLYGSVAVLADEGHSFAENAHLFHSFSSYGTTQPPKRHPNGPP